MTEAGRFLERIGEYLGLGPTTSDATRAEIVRDAMQCLEALRLAEPSSDFILDATGVSWGHRGLQVDDAAWLERLRADGVAVLAPPNDERGFARWLERLARQVGRHTATPPAVTDGPGPESAAAEPEAPASPAPQDALHAPTSPRSRAETLQPEADLVWELHEQAYQGLAISFQTASAVAANLAAALDRAGLTAEPRVISTLDEYSTIHCLNTAMLSMKLARHLAHDESDVRAVGVAGLLHDIGKSRLGNLPAVSLDMLSPDERGVLRAHTEEGARLLLDSGGSFRVAAIVAHEHHMHWHGEGGYPARHYERVPHPLSRLVSVCDVYDVLREERSFRPALGAEAAIKYLRVLGGQVLDPDMVGAFADMASATLPRVELPTARPPVGVHEIGWLPETGYDADCEPRPVRV